MEVFDNITKIVRDDLIETIKPHGRVSKAFPRYGKASWSRLR